MYCEFANHLYTNQEKMSLAFRLFQKQTISRRDCNELFTEIGEFLSEIGLGITDAVEFLIIQDHEFLFQKYC